MMTRRVASSLLLIGAVFAQNDLQEFIEEPLLPIISPAHPSTSPAWAPLWDVLPTVPFTVEPFESGWLYESCVGRSSSYSAYNIIYEDCPEPWQVCVDQAAGISIESAAEMFGKLPVGFRQHIRDLSVSNGQVAYWTQGSIIMTPNFFRLYVMIHEAAHAVDLVDTETLGVPTRAIYSSTDEWRDAYYSDISAVTPGANVDWLENFAEQAPRAFYDTYVEGGVANFQPNWEEHANQLQAFKALVGGFMQLGGTCQFRIPNTPLVEVVGSSQSRRDVETPSTGCSDI